MARYTYIGRQPEYMARGLGIKWSSWHGRQCDPVLRADGKIIIGRKPRNVLVRFADDGSCAVVPLRVLRVNDVIHDTG